jgi:peptidoglycan/xylan/chitin deacetylase (PgdA/CDA1 family)
MIRSIGKTLFACGYRWSGTGFWSSRLDARCMPFMVAYHRVVENYSHSAKHSIPAMLVAASTLERHLDWLGSHFQFASLDEAASRLQSGDPFEKPTAVVTFDDGYRDVYRHAYPILRRKGIPAAVFIVSGLTGSNRLQVCDRLYLQLQRLLEQKTPLESTLSAVLRAIGVDPAGMSRLGRMRDHTFNIMTFLLTRYPYGVIQEMMAALETHVQLDENMLDELGPMSWDMVETMHRGGIAIGSHTSSHVLLTQEGLSTVRQELAHSRRAIEARLGSPVKHVAYPDGRFNVQVIQAALAAGYQFGYGICLSRDQSNPLLTIPRKVLWEKACSNVIGRFSPSIMHCHTHWAFEDPGRCGHDHEVSPICQGPSSTA